MSLDYFNIDVEDFLECLEIENIQVRGDQVYFSCPFPGHDNGDSTPSATMNTDTTAFFCYACREKGNAVHFVTNLLKCSPMQAISMLRQRYQPGGINPDAVRIVDEVKKILQAADTEEKPQPVLPESALDRFETDWYAVAKALTWPNDPADVPEPFQYMQSRGFGPDVLTDWEFGYDPLSGRITFAVRDADGALIGFKARAHDGRHPKYLVLGDYPNRRSRYGWPCYFTSRVLFGANRIQPGSELVVCEGELNAIAVSSRTGRPAVAINGSHFSDRHARILRNLADKVILFLDDDKAGRDAVWGWKDSKGIHQPGIVERLKDFMPVSLVPRQEKDAAEMQGGEIEELLSHAESALLRSLATV